MPVVDTPSKDIQDYTLGQRSEVKRKVNAENGESIDEPLSIAM